MNTTIAAAIAASNDKNGTAGETAIQIKTSIHKGRDGWRGESSIDLGINVKLPGREPALPARLDISTYKSHAGIITTANVVQVHDGMVTFVIGGSFHERIAQRANRCTEKTVRDQHDEAMASVSEVITRAKAYYAAKAEAQDINDRRKRELADQDAIAMRERNERPEFDPRGEDIALGHVQS